MVKQLHTILIVDDEEIIRDSFEDIFTSKGYRVVMAKNGFEALDIVKDTIVDLAIVDIKMPKMSGLELLQRLKKDHADLPVIIMTGYGSEDTAMQALKLGASNYIKKPFNLLNVINSIEKVLFYKVTRDRIHKKEILVKRTLENLRQFELSFPINLETIEGGVIFISEYLFDESPYKTNIEIGIHEALLNAYYYGSLGVKGTESEEDTSYDFYEIAAKRAKDADMKDKKIILNVVSTDDYYRFTITDDGDGFNWQEVSDNVESELEKKTFGRGITLIKSFFDKVTWNEKGNAITMTLIKKK